MFKYILGTATDTAGYIDKIVSSDSIIYQEKRGGGITVDILIPSDSIEYYLKKIKLEEKVREEEYQKRKVNQDVHNIYRNTLALKLGYINIDKILERDSSISVEIEILNKNINKITSYFVYKDLNSFISNYHSLGNNTNLKFDYIPYLKNKTSLIIVGNKKEKLYVGKVDFKEIPTSKIKVKLEETSKEEFQQLIENHLE